MIGIYPKREEELKFHAIKYVNGGCPLHFHKKVEMLYVLTEEHLALINGKEYYGTPGDIFFVNPYDVHQFSSEKKGMHLFLSFSTDLFRDVGLVIEGKRLPSLLTDKPINEKIKPFLEKATSEDLSYLGQAHIICGIMDVLVSNYGLTEQKVEQTNDVVRDLVIYFNNNFRKPLDREELSKRYGYSTSYLSHVFKKQMGIGMVEFLNTIRYEAVRQQLQAREKREKTIIDIVLSCGFDSISSYYRFAKKLDSSYKNVIEYTKFQSEYDEIEYVLGEKERGNKE